MVDLLIMNYLEYCAVLEIFLNISFTSKGSIWICVCVCVFQII